MASGRRTGGYAGPKPASAIAGQPRHEIVKRPDKDDGFDVVIRRRRLSEHTLSGCAATAA
jgi:hypothetical protein